MLKSKQRNQTALDWEIQREFPIEARMPTHSVGELLRNHGADYLANHRLLSRQRRVIRDLAACRTHLLGAHIDECDHCHSLDISYNSCRNRHCPKCQGSQREAWVSARELELLPIQYFHLVFTLPQALLPYVRYNETLLYNLLMTTAADTLQRFADKRWKGKLGITMALHTWGQTLNHHPHVHCIVSGGVLTHDGSRFIRAPRNFLFPIAALSKVFRQTFISALKQRYHNGELNPKGPQLETDSAWRDFMGLLYKHDWVVYAKQTSDHPAHLIRYIGRYINRVAISDQRIARIGSATVRINYHDNRDNQDKRMNLSIKEFIRRYLTHVLPKGFRRIRYYGFLINSQRKQALTLCRKRLNLVNPERPYIADLDRLLTRLGNPNNLCLNCDIGTLRPSVLYIASNSDPPTLNALVIG